MSVRIIIDSTTNMNSNLLNKVTVVPLTVHFGDEEYVDTVTISHKEFYEKLIETDVIPHTSQATPTDFESVFNEVKQKGDSAVVITLSSKLSGTYQSAMIAASDYNNIFVVDSGSVAIGAGVLTEYALNLVLKDMSAEDIAKELEKQKEKVCIIAMLDTLEYLKKGGRISKTVAFAGGILNLKPVIAVEKGEIIMLGKARGSKQGNNLLVTEIEKVGGVDFSKPILLGYTGLSDALLQKYIEDSADLWKQNANELNVAIVGSVIGTHAGPGAIAAAFFKNN